ncbi:MAG: hypothetical protein AAGA60_30090 [Cyanobacteria bacterium P01_E01_bin.42]
MHVLLEPDSEEWYHIKMSRHWLLQSHDDLEFARSELLKRRSGEEMTDNVYTIAKEIGNG